MQPLRKSRSIFLKEKVLVNAVGVAFEQEWTALEMRNEQISHTIVKIDEIALGIAIGRVENFFQVGELELASVDGERGFSLIRRKQHFPFCRRGGSIGSSQTGFAND